MTLRETVLLSCIVVGAVMGGLSMVQRAIPHDAPTGWSYPPYCCSTTDCRAVPSETIGEGRDGYTIKRTGEIVGYLDTRLKDSPDGEYHWCSVSGADTTSTVCLFVPPRSF